MVSVRAHFDPGPMIMPNNNDAALFHTAGDYKISADKAKNTFYAPQYPGEVTVLQNASNVLKFGVNKTHNPFWYKITHRTLENWYALAHDMPPLTPASYFHGLQAVVDRLKDSKTAALNNGLLGNVKARSHLEVIFHAMGEALEAAGVPTMDEAVALNDDLEKLRSVQDSTDNMKAFNDDVTFIDRCKMLTQRAQGEPAVNGQKPTLQEFVSGLRALQDGGHLDLVRDVIEGTLRALPNDSVETWTLDAAQQEAQAAEQEDEDEEGEVR